MKRKISKLLATITCIAVIVLTLPSGIKSQAISVDSVKSQLDYIINYEYKPGNTPPSGSYRSGTSGCYGFADLIYRKIFGHNLSPQASAMQLQASSNFNQIGSTLSKSAGNLNESTLKSMFLQAVIGDVVQMDYTTYSNEDSRHTMIIYSVSDSGVVFYHAGSSKVYFGASSGTQPLWGTTGNVLTWSKLLNVLKSSDDGISLYRSKSVTFAPSDTTAPVINALYTEHKSADGFNVICECTDNVGVTSVRIAVWTANNGQDDLIWSDATIVSSYNYANLRVNRSDHNYEYGQYIIHAYVYDAAGNNTCLGIGEVLESDGSEMSSGYERVLPDGDYLIVNAGTIDKTSFYFLDILGTEQPASALTNVSICGPALENIHPCEAWTITYSEGFYTIKQKGTEMALDVLDASKASGANIEVYPSNTSSAQKWAISYNDRNGYRIQAKCSGMSLDLEGAHCISGTNIQQCQNNNSDAQSWLFIPYQPSQPLNNGKYILSSALGNDLVLYPENASDNIVVKQKTNIDDNALFEITKINDGYYSIVHCATGKALDVTNGVSTENVNVALCNKNGSIAQQWAIREHNGKYTFVSRCNGYVLDVYGAKAEDNTNVFAYKNHEANNQQWLIKGVSGYYTYELFNNEAYIVNCDNSIEGDVIIPSTLDGYPVVSIGQLAFYNCVEITDIAIPDSVKRIRSDAFWGCQELKKISIPKNVEIIDSLAFEQCANLSEIIVDKDNQNYYVDGNCLIERKSKSIIAGTNNSMIPDDGSVVEIQSYAFSGLNGLESISIPESIETFYGTCFKSCDSLKEIYIYSKNANLYFAEYIPKQTTLYCYEGSTAEAFAIKNNLKYELIVDHTHTFNTWEKDSENHWQKCTECGEVADTAAHIYDDDSDTTCNVCGYERQVETPTIDPPTIDENDTHIAVNGKTARPGEEIKVTVSLKNAPKITSMAASDIVYDKNVLTLKSAEWLVKNSTMQSWNSASQKGVISFENERDLNGDVLELTFVVSDSAEDGEYNIGLAFKMTENEEQKTVAVKEGIITVKNYITGDMNGDEKITDQDAIYLLFSYYFPDEYPINQPADFNKDGKVTDQDAIYLLFYYFFPDEYPIE